MRTSIGDVPAREILDELVRRVGVEETCRLVGDVNPVAGTPVSDLAGLHQLAVELDRRVSMTADRITCAPWCTDGDGHPDAVCRADQCCHGVQTKVVLGLEAGAPSLPLAAAIGDGSPGVTVYAYRAWHGLPHLRLNVFRLGPERHLDVDVDLDVTAGEARELARHLLQLADQVDPPPT